MNTLIRIVIDCFDKNMLIEYYIIICELLESKGIDTAKAVIEEKETWVRLYFENKDLPKDLNISNYLFSNVKDFSFLVEINELNLGKAYSYSELKKEMIKCKKLFLNRGRMTRLKLIRNKFNCDLGVCNLVDKEIFD